MDRSRVMCASMHGFDWCAIGVRCASTIPWASDRARSKSEPGVLPASWSAPRPRVLGSRCRASHFFISYRAYVEVEWVRTGLDILVDIYGYERDYLLPLPNQTFSGPMKRRAVYSDAVAFSRRLLGNLKVGDSEEFLLCDEAVTYWSEHSDRCGLDTWCAALGIAS